MITRFLLSLMIPKILLVGLIFFLGFSGWSGQEKRISNSEPPEREVSLPELKKVPLPANGVELPETPTNGTFRGQEDLQMQIEVPKLPSPNQDEAEKARLKDPLYQQLEKMFLNEAKERFGDLNSPPSLSLPTGQERKPSEVSSKDWHAIELLLQAARLLDEEGTSLKLNGRGLSEGERAEERLAVARRIRAEVIGLLQVQAAR